MQVIPLLYFDLNIQCIKLLFTYLGLVYALTSHETVCSIYLISLLNTIQICKVKKIPHCRNSSKISSNNRRNN